MKIFDPNAKTTESFYLIRQIACSSKRKHVHRTVKEKLFTDPTHRGVCGVLLGSISGGQKKCRLGQQ